jgi:hypothetical protein
MKSLKETSEATRLIDRLFSDSNRKLVNFSVFRGDGVASAEDIAREINRALDQHESGKAIASATYEDNRTTVNVRDFVAGL